MGSSSKSISTRIACFLLAIVMMAGMCIPVGATGEVSLDALENVHIVDAEAVTEEPSVEEPAVAQAPAAPENAAPESAELENAELENAELESANVPPPIPTNIWASWSGNGYRLTWSAPVGCSVTQKYTISYCKMSDIANLPSILPYDKSVAKLIDVVGCKGTYVLTDLEVGEYFFTIAAVNDAGTGDMLSCLKGMFYGDGTEKDPYRISTNTNLVKLREASRAYQQCYMAYPLSGRKAPASGFSAFGNGLYFKQTADLSLSGAGIPFFSGIYDGGGHSVALSLNNTSSNAVAFIEYLEGDADHPGTLKNITATGSVNAENLKGILNVGALAAVMTENSKLYNANSVAEVKGGTSQWLGGLVGLSQGLIANCGCAGIVSSTATSNLSIGGLAGINTGIIFNCWYGGASKPTYTTASAHCGWLTGDINFVGTGTVAYGYAPGGSLTENIGYKPDAGNVKYVETKTVAQMKAADFATLLNNNKNNSNNLSAYAPGLTASGLWNWKVNSDALPTLSDSVTVPDAPTFLRREPLTCTLSWTAPANNGGTVITKYVVSYQAGSAAAQTKDVTGTSTTLTGLTIGATYKITVKAVNSVGESAASNSNTYIHASVPGAPTNLSVSQGTTGCDLTWTPPTNTGGVDICYYTVYYQRQDGTKEEKLTILTSTTLTSLIGGATYKITVKAINDGGRTSEASNTVTYAAPVTVPDAPTGFKLGSVGCSLSWTAPADNGGAAVTKYVVSYQTGSAAAKTKEVTETSTTLTGLTGGASYNITVKAVNSAGESAASILMSYTHSAVGVTISGKLSFTGKVGGLTATVALLQGGETKYSESVAYVEGGNTYTLSNVAAGTYTLQITKLGHLTYTDAAFVVGEEAIELNDFKLFAGKVTTGNRILFSDLQQTVGCYNSSDALYDFDENGKVQMKDLTISCVDYNKEYTTLTAKKP